MILAPQIPCKPNKSANHSFHIMLVSHPNAQCKTPGRLICWPTGASGSEEWNKGSRRTMVGKPQKRPSKLRKIYRAAKHDLMPYEKRVS